MKKPRIAPLPALLLTLAVAYFLLSFGTSLAVLAATAADWFGAIILRLFQGAGFLMLIVALGAAFGAVAEGRGYRRPYLILLFAVAAYLFGVITGLIWSALFFSNEVAAEELSLILGSLFDSAILPLFATFILTDRIFLVKGGAEPRDWRDIDSNVVRGALLATGLFFVYRLIGQIIESVSFVKEMFGFTFMTTGEKLAMVLDYIPVFVLPAAGYFILLWSRRQWLLATERRATDEKKPTSNKK